MNRHRVIINYSLRGIILLSVIFFHYSYSLSEPEGDGEISGFIFNASRQPLAGVEVRAVASSSIYFQRMTYSAKDGSYVIDQLPVGQYFLRIQNKLGYLDVYYDNTIDQSDAKLIKINAGQHVSNINFYLERGGYISGYIFDTHGNLLTRNTSIGFFDAQNFTLRGFISGNADGSYISPALPNRPHIVKASSLPEGYIISYYNNVSTQDSAQAIYVNPPDTIKNINFYLPKGGAISGQVRSEEPENIPIADAWMVVTDWQTGEWSSEAHTDSTGYYCAAGLRPGTYRVQVYSVDPLKYHNEYYKDSPQRENATRVFVDNRETIGHIDFTLKGVKKLLFSNDFIEYAVSDRYPGTNLSLGITNGLPETPKDNNKPILFGHPYPYTSFTTVWIDGQKMIFGSPEGNLIDDPYISQDGKSIARKWDYHKITVEQKITPVVSEWSETKYEDTALIQYVVTNNDNIPHDIGLRILFDTMLGKDDAAQIRTSNSVYSSYEQDFYAPDIPAWWTAIELENGETVFSVQGTLQKYGAVSPDRFSIVNWSNIFQTKWDYKINDHLGVIKDSGVALWWNPVTIAPSMVKIVCTYIGLGEMYPDKEPPYTKNHLPMKYTSNNLLDTNIQLDVLDDYMGVDSASIVMRINDKIITPKISGTLQQYRLFYDPPTNFHYNDTVRVEIQASDLAPRPNKMEPDIYEFYVVKDTEKPIIQNLYPEHAARNIPPDTSLSFIVADKHSGVDKNSIGVFLKGVAIQPQIEGDSSQYSVRYHFQPPLDEMDSVLVRIKAADLARPSNKIDTTIYFIVARDSIAPWVENYFPHDQATEVSLDTTIHIELRDDIAGTDIKSIKFYFNGLSANPEINGDPRRYLITYRPENGFLYNQNHRIILEARDLAKQPNIMPPFAFSFYSETDTTPPSIMFIKPILNDTLVSQTPFVSLEIKDEKAGVDSAAIQLWLNNKVVKFVLEGDKNFYKLKYQCKDPFDYLEWVTVKVFAQDKSNPPNAADTAKYQFRITREKDEAPPYVTQHHPAKDTTDVDPDCFISFHVKDDLSGVDKSSLKLKVNGNSVSPIIAGSVHDFMVVYKPSAPFRYGQRVLLEIDAQDLVPEKPNVMKTDSCLFTIMFDTSPPEVIWIKPGQPGDHIPLDSEFTAEIVDSLTGVDVNSLNFKFQGQIIAPQIENNDKRYQIHYQPLDRLQYNQQINFIITGCDLATPANWIKDSLFTFYTIEDHDPPFISSQIPQKNEVGLEFGTAIVITLEDKIAGVEMNSIKMMVDGKTISPSISGNPNCYKIIYQNPVGYKPGQRVDFILEATDLSNPPNRMKPDSSSFFIKDVFADIFIKSFSLNQSIVLVHRPVQILATVGVDIAPVFDPIPIKIWDNNFVILDTIVARMNVGDITDFSTSISFNDHGKHQIKIEVDPENKIRESNEQNNSAMHTIEVVEGELIVRSNPFTPNGDGINDDVTFDFEKLSVTDPLLKVYDVAGRMIITIKDRQGYKFIWNGFDRFGNPAQPGVYLYLLQDLDKTMANGYIVLAR